VACGEVLYREVLYQLKMEGQPLKGKTIEVKLGGKTEFGHLDKDIASAIEWLKRETNKIASLDLIDHTRLNNSIDIAFEGVQG